MRRIIAALVGATTLSAALASVALGADLPARMLTKAPAAIAVDPWTGWYLGASAGARLDKDTWTATGFEIPAAPGAVISRDNPHNFSFGSGRVGLYGGYNWRLPQMWVVGLEADIAWADKKSSTPGIPGLIPAFPANDTVHVRDMWDGGLRARLGYLVTPATLLYATGGASWMQTQAGVTCNSNTGWCGGTNATSNRTDIVSKTVAGWTVGAGLEAAVTSNWLVRGEYRYASYADYHATLLQGGNGANGNLDVVEADIKNRTHTVLVGLAYKFGQ